MKRKGRAWRAIVCAMLAMAASGCSTHAPWVNCEGRLESINQPASKTPASPSSSKAADRVAR